MKHTNLTILLTVFLVSVVSSSCNHSNSSGDREKILTEKENELLKKENELLKKEQELNSKLPDTTQNQTSVQPKFTNSTANNLEILRRLNGKYPYEAKLFNNTAFTYRLKKLLGNRYNFLKETWAVEIPIEFNDNIFVASACQAHNCSLTNFIVVYDFSSDIMYAGIREQNKVNIYSENGGSSPKITAWANKNSVGDLPTNNSNNSISSIFYLGDELNPNTKNFKLLGISSQTNVSTYQYVGEFTDKYFYGRQIGDIIVGVKNGKIVTTIYNLIPEKNDVGVSSEIITLIQKTLPFPLAYRNGIYGVNIDNTTISLSRTNNPMTFNQDRIMFLTSVKQSILNQ